MKLILSISIVRLTQMISGFNFCNLIHWIYWRLKMKVLVPIKRVVDYNVKIRVKSDNSGVE